MKTRLKQLAKDSVLYGIGSVVTNAVLFFLLPIYTRIFAPDEYGMIETLTMLTNFLSVLLMMGMNAAQSYYFFEQKKNGKAAQAQVVTAIFQWRLIYGSFIVILATFLAPLLNRIFFNSKLTLGYFAVAFMGALFVQFMGQSASIFQLLYRPLKYIFITLGYAVFSSLIAIIFIVKLGWGIKGHFIGFAIGAILSALLGWWLIRDYLDFSNLQRNWWPKLIKFGSPITINELFLYGLQTADRWFIIYYLGQSALGIYAVGAKFVLLISLAVAAFRQAFWPMAMDALHQTEGAEVYRRIARLYLGLGVIACLLITSLSPVLIKLLSGSLYQSAYPIIGILSWYAIFYGFYVFTSAGIWKTKKTILGSIAMGIAALFNIVLNIFMVPRFGSIGAALATAISFLIWNCITLLISEKYWPINYPLGIFALQIGIGVTGTSWILSIYQNNLPMWQASAITVIFSIATTFTFLRFNKFIRIFQNIKIKIQSI